ncbi:hypothetical protein DP939_26265 [Spongiactinospora rosea]|uniref:Uncharacterized protein n=1 Tax=Spongiactinospora rosea TaxID=2248750 RepID=A0A366LSV5_9ACTN|nr:hypothetical protein DP939_26265 [Spongiactinospora rosea]
MDVTATADLRDLKQTGSFPRRLPPPVPARPAAEVYSLLPQERPADRRTGPFARVAELPMRVAYTIAATVATVIVVVLIFVVFGGDEYGRRSSVRSAEVTTSPTPTPAAPPSVPPVPKSKGLPVHAGSGSVAIGLVEDPKAGLAYPRLAAPWTVPDSSPFSRAQRAGKWRAPYTMVVSGLLPGAAHASPSGEAELRAAAAAGARWSLSAYHPPGATLAWTGSRPLAAGKGWVLTYTVTYRTGDAKHTSRAAIVVADTGKRRPGMVLVSVPDTRKVLWPDIAKVVNGVTLG